VKTAATIAAVAAALAVTGCGGTDEPKYNANDASSLRAVEQQIRSTVRANISRDPGLASNTENLRVSCVPTTRVHVECMVDVDATGDSYSTGEHIAVPWTGDINPETGQFAVRSR
jgi:hypothetical protein